MKITFILNGKTEDKYLIDGCSIFEKRLKHYISFEQIVIPALKKAKNLSPDQFKAKEAELMMKHIKTDDVVVLLDEHGKEYTSVGFSDYLQKQMNAGIKNLVFIVGGPFGFDEQLRSRANHMLSISKMTFSHQMIRLFFLEQIYRAFTILKNEPYHNE
ncbi:MAG: 23S rRNA (pseudouridine(1915)-N(3))-methyltransferase RlmH [Bacteroidales bacterium]|nr:23S rRNA (pseudouridine(1915)-N(3))-methyltransferase RlmH [Bacteroidales bacterium]